MISFDFHYTGPRHCTECGRPCSLYTVIEEDGKTKVFCTECFSVRKTEELTKGFV